MALNRSNKYPGRFLAPNAAHPQGAFKNRTSPTAQDGSYLEASWANDIAALNEAILTAAGVTPNGNEDTATVNQVFDSLKNLFAAVAGSSTRDFAVRNSGDINNAVNNARLNSVLQSYAALAGSGSQQFSVANGTVGSHAVNKSQLDAGLLLRAETAGNQFTSFNVGGATAPTHAVRLDQFTGGNNTNGAWIKLPGGGMWGRQNLTLAANNTTQWNYPAIFPSAPAVFITAINGPFQCWLNGIGPNSCGIFNNGAALNVNLLAIY